MNVEDLGWGDGCYSAHIRDQVVDLIADDLVVSDLAYDVLAHRTPWSLMPHECGFSQLETGVTWWR